MASQRLPGGSAGRELRRLLIPSEQVEAYAKGKNGALLVATDRRVIMTRKSWTGRRQTGSFGYQQIASVERMKNMWGAFIVINAAGVPGAQLTNTFPISLFGAGDTGQAVAVIQSHLYAPTAPSTQAGPANIPEQIAALAQLRDTGVLTPNEFEVKKADLLRRL